MLIAILELTNPYKYGISSHGVPSYLAVAYNTTDNFYAVGYKEKPAGNNLLCIIKPVTEAATNKIPRADLVRVIGPCGDITAEKEALLLFYAGLQPNAAQRRSIQEAATAVSQYIPCLENRRQLTGFTFHIDPEGCRDVDDIITINRLSNNQTEIIITISDVAEYIAANSLLDKTAAANGQTFYNNKGTVMRPMLPSVLSEGCLSLLPRDSHSIGVSLYCIWDNNTSELTVNGFAETYFKVDKTYTYDSFITEASIENVCIMRDVCSKLYGLETDDTHIWIEQLMLLYNREAGKKLRDAGQGILRRQTASLPSCVPVLPFLGTAAAQYIPASSDDTYHSGLSTEFYCHATSPIRRYVDLVNQRILKGCMTSSEYSIDALNIISKNQRKYARSIYFLENVAGSGMVNGIVIEIGNKIHVYVEQWRMIIKVKYVMMDNKMMSPDESREYNVAVGDEIKIKYAVQYNKRRWKDKIVFEICGDKLQC